MSGTLPSGSCGTEQRDQPEDEEEDNNNNDDNNSRSDSDKDGVIDSKDLCPNTPQGTSVTSNGCPKPVEEETFVDTDGDGVVDQDDTCPDTEAGVEVDDTGCPVESEPVTPPPVTYLPREFYA